MAHLTAVMYCRKTNVLGAALPSPGSKGAWQTHVWAIYRADAFFDRPDSAYAVSRSVSPNQEIHNYYEEISTHIKYKLTEYKGLTAAWQQHQDADTAVEQATSAVTHAEDEVCISITAQ